MLALLVTGMLASCAGTPDSASQVQANKAVAGQVRNFKLYVRENTLKMPDGKQIYVFGYTDDPKGPAKIPGPTLLVNEGDTVNLTLVDDRDPTKTKFNPDGDGHTFHLHGLDLPSSFDGDPMTAPGQHSIMQGDSYTYHFVAKHAGTYWYHCHEGAAEHIQMGMYGAFIVLPNGEPHRAYAATPTFDKDYTDALHKGGDEFNWSQYHPDYFLINGKAWPDIMSDPTSTIDATVGQRVLVRLINTGYVSHSLHSHGFHFLVLGSDGRKVPEPYEKDTLVVGPGERYEILFTLDQIGRYMFHDHFEQNTTNNGGYPGGMMTMINVNNKDGSNPVPMPKMKVE